VFALHPAGEKQSFDLTKLWPYMYPLVAPSQNLVMDVLSDNEVRTLPPLASGGLANPPAGHAPVSRYISGLPSDRKFVYEVARARSYFTQPELP